MKRILTVLMVGVMIWLGFAAVPGNSQPPDAVRANNVRVFMRVKLKHARQVLEGLAIEDFDKIAKSSQEMSLLSLASNWQVLQTAKYVEHSRDFRRAADRITEAARKGNLDAATLGYVEMTMRCVDCHKYVREVRIGSLDTNRINDRNTPVLLR